MTAFQIDLNCDMGESYGQFKIGNDDKIFPYITSCNVACGFHGGDPLHIETTIKKALEHGVKVGAHPSYPDLAGFGRRKMELPKAELKAVLKYQISALKGMTESLGGRLGYVKPHGALYNAAANSETDSLTIIEAVREVDSNLILMGLAGSTTEEVASQEQMPFVAEAFADRKYLADGKLMPRARAGSVLNDPALAAEQVLSIVQHHKVKSDTGVAVNISAQSICIHGDNAAAVIILQAIDRAFEQNDITKKSFS